MTAPRTQRDFSWIISNLWRPVTSSGSFEDVTGDGVEVRVLDTVIVEKGNVKSWLFTDKRGFVARMERGEETWEKIYKDFLKNINASGSGSSTLGSPGGNNDGLAQQSSLGSLDLATLPCAIVHKENGDQTLVDSLQFRTLCQMGQFPTDTVAVQRFVPPRGADLIGDGELTKRNVDAMVGTYFYTYNFGATNPICYKAGGE